MKHLEKHSSLYKRIGLIQEILIGLTIGQAIIGDFKPSWQSWILVAVWLATFGARLFFKTSIFLDKIGNKIRSREKWLWDILNKYTVYEALKLISCFGLFITTLSMEFCLALAKTSSSFEFLEGPERIKASIFTAGMFILSYVSTVVLGKVYMWLTNE